MKNNKKFYNFANITEQSADLYIYGNITSYGWDDSDVSAYSFKEDLEELKNVSEINVHINSYGGETVQGLAIYNLLKQHSAIINVFIDGAACSSASIIAMAGDKVYMPKSSLMMIHNCWTWASGNAKELRKQADDMDKMAVAYTSAYMAKVNITEERLKQLLDEETWLTAEECIEMGFADEIIEDQENNTINQNANLCILNLVKREKQKEEKAINVETNEETLQKICEYVNKKFSEEIKTLENQVINGTGNEEPKGLLNKQNNANQDTFLVSFLNNFIK